MNDITGHNAFCDVVDGKPCDCGFDGGPVSPFIQALKKPPVPSWNASRVIGGSKVRIEVGDGHECCSVELTLEQAMDFANALGALAKVHEQA